MSCTASASIAPIRPATTASSSPAAAFIARGSSCSRRSTGASSATFASDTASARSWDGSCSSVAFAPADWPAAVENGLHVGARLLVWRDAVVAPHGAGPGVVGGQREHGPELVGEAGGRRRRRRRGRAVCPASTTSGPGLRRAIGALAGYSDSTAMTACTGRGRRRAAQRRRAAGTRRNATGTATATTWRAVAPHRGPSASLD